MRISNTANRIKEIMNKEDLKQVDILHKALPYCEKYDTQITKVDLSQYVSGKVEPGQAKLFVLANALNVNEAWLMGYDVPKERNTIINTAHIEISDSVLLAIQTLAAQSGYDFSFFANQFQVAFNDCLVKLSPAEVDDLSIASIEQVKFVLQNIIDGKLRGNIVPIRQDTELNAAHERTDIKVTDEMRKHDDDIMNDDNF